MKGTGFGVPRLRGPVQFRVYAVPVLNSEQKKMGQGPPEGGTPNKSREKDRLKAEQNPKSVS